MTILEATGEIVKATCQQGGASTTNTTYVLTNAETRKGFLEGIAAVYKELEKLTSK